MKNYNKNSTDLYTNHFIYIIDQSIITVRKLIYKIKFVNNQNSEF